MSKSRLVLTDRAEAAVVEQIEVRLVRPEEEARWEELMIQHHYLKSARMVGEQLRYVAEHQGQWLALLGWSAASYHLKGRDGWIGWSDNQRRARLHLVANNARFCRLGEPGQYPNLASQAMALNLARLSEDWQAKYGHPIVLVESFVDLQWFRGTAYKASGWKAIGTTAGFKRVAEDFYEAHERPKQLYVRELRKHALRGLRGRELPGAWNALDRPIERGCSLKGEELLSLWRVLHQEVPESRNAQGLRHRQATVLAITFAFLLSGGQGGHRAIALFAQDLTPRQRASLRCWFNRRTRRYDVPTENCFYRVLKAVPVLAFQQALWAWQKGRLGTDDGDVVVLDGKGAARQRPDPVGGRHQRAERADPGRRKGSRQEQRNSGRADAPGSAGLGRDHRADGCLAHASQNGPRDRAGRRGGFRAGGQRQPGRPSKASHPLPSGSFFPLNIKRSIKATAGSNGVASRCAR